MLEPATLELFIPDAGAMEALGGRLAACCPAGTVVFLQGELGTGKTTLVRGLLHALGHRGPVRSPTYTLVEPYELASRRVYHFDLYRLADAEELEYLGVREYLDGEALSLVEWPEKGGGWLPQADLSLSLEYRKPGRRLWLAAASGVGRAILECLEKRVKA